MICQLPANLHDFKLDSYEFHCFGSPTALFEFQQNLFRIRTRGEGYSRKLWIGCAAKAPEP